MVRRTFHVDLDPALLAERHAGLRRVRNKLITKTGDIELVDGYLRRRLGGAFGKFGQDYVGEMSARIDRIFELRNKLSGDLDTVLGGGSVHIDTIKHMFEDLSNEMDHLVSPRKHLETQKIELPPEPSPPAAAPKAAPAPAAKAPSEPFVKLRTKYESVLKENSYFKDALARIERDAESADPRVRSRANSERRELEGLMKQYEKASQAKEEWARVERKGRAESRAYWLGRETDTEFARHEQNFDSIAKTLENKRDALAATGQQGLLPSVDAAILKMSVDEFVRQRGSADLIAEWNRLNEDPYLRQKLYDTFDLSKDPTVGGRRPDIVEFFLAGGEIVVTDMTLDVESSIHQFKTRFYREVMQMMVGGEGPNVFGHDIDPRVRPGAPRGVVHDEPLPL